jgi:hypothetical protein
MNYTIVLTAEEIRRYVYECGGFTHPNMFVTRCDIVTRKKHWAYIHIDPKDAR